MPLLALKMGSIDFSIRCVAMKAFANIFYRNRNALTVPYTFKSWTSLKWISTTPESKKTKEMTTKKYHETNAKMKWTTKTTKNIDEKVFIIIISIKRFNSWGVCDLWWTQYGLNTQWQYTTNMTNYSFSSNFVWRQ